MDSLMGYKVRYKGRYMVAAKVPAYLLVFS